MSTAFYGTELEADEYHEDRGNTAWAALDSAAKTVALMRGTDYLDQMFRVRLRSGRWVSSFCGEKTDPAQFREFPRDGLPTPEAAEYAVYEAALREAANPGSLMPDYVPSEGQGPVTEETVGPITVKYANLTQNKSGYGNRPPNLPVIMAIETLVAPLLCGVASTLDVGIRTV